MSAPETKVSPWCKSYAPNEANVGKGARQPEKSQTQQKRAPPSTLCQVEVKNRCNDDWSFRAPAHQIARPWTVCLRSEPGRHGAKKELSAQRSHALPVGVCVRVAAGSAGYAFIAIAVFSAS